MKLMFIKKELMKIKVFHLLITRCCFELKHN